jgi:hypothetical protein
MAPGRERLLVLANAYLDACLKQRGARALLFEARADPAIPQAIADRNAEVAEELSADFTVLGWGDPEAGAALWNGMVCEAVLAEFRAQGRLPEIRGALARFLPETPDARPDDPASALFRAALLSPYETVTLRPSRGFADETIRQFVRIPAPAHGR